MITQLQVKNFKSWADTGNLPLAPLTGFFGTNSSGKSSILQLLLMLKQTAASPDRKRVLNMGDVNSLVDLGTFDDLIHNHDSKNSLDISLSWDYPDRLYIRDFDTQMRKAFYLTNSLTFSSTIREIGDRIMVDQFSYSSGKYSFGLERKNNAVNKKNEYAFITKEYKTKRYQGRPWPLPPPVKCYGFPDEVTGYYQNVGFLSQFVLKFEELFRGMTYLGPLREYPRRTYTWAGENLEGVGWKGEQAVPALLASQNKGKIISLGKRKWKQTVEERIAHWLQKMGLIDSFKLNPIAENRKYYELLVKITPNSPEVLITDVGFGVSQILPVLVLCYYVPEGSIILLEQPEIHLHPSAQSWLADVFIEAVKYRNIQIILESHSEHLLRRLQRRIAEEEISADKTALYFCRMENSASHIEQLDIDLFGNIRNWPKDFFGDELGELSKMAEAVMNREMKKG